MNTLSARVCSTSFALLAFFFRIPSVTASCNMPKFTLFCVLLLLLSMVKVSLLLHILKEESNVIKEWFGN